MKSKIIVILATLVVISAGEASAAPLREPQPQLYPNGHLAKVGETQAQLDINGCTNAAAAYVHNSRQPGQGAKKVLGSAAKGAVLGTIGGAIGGNTGRGAAAGSVMGATRAAATGIKQRGAGNPAFQQYVNACLEDKGYKVLGWG